MRAVSTKRPHMVESHAELGTVFQCNTQGDGAAARHRRTRAPTGLVRSRSSTGSSLPKNVRGVERDGRLPVSRQRLARSRSTTAARLPRRSCTPTGTSPSGATLYVTDNQQKSHVPGRCRYFPDHGEPELMTASSGEVPRSSCVRGDNRAASPSSRCCIAILLSVIAIVGTLTAAVPGTDASRAASRATNTEATALAEDPGRAAARAAGDVPERQRRVADQRASRASSDPNGDLRPASL